MLKNFIFSVFFFSGIVLISIVFLPALLMPKKIVLIGGKLMGYWTGFCLKTIFLGSRSAGKNKIEIIIIPEKKNIEKIKFFNITLMLY